MRYEIWDMGDISHRHVLIFSQTIDECNVQINWLIPLTQTEPSACMLLVKDIK